MSWYGYAGVVFLLSCAAAVSIDVKNVNAAVPVLKWSRTIPSLIRESSPMPISLNGSMGSMDVIFGAHDGNLYALNGDNGANISGWPRQTGHPINSTPSSSEIDNGEMRIFIGTGTADGQCSGGALQSYKADGSRIFSATLADNVTGPGAQCSTPAVHSSPVIGDTNNDNIPDINIGVLSLKAWSLKFDGGVNSGWPYYWDDTQFATTALVDVNGDGVTDMIRGGDSSPGAPIDHRGGIVKAMGGNGTVLWEYRIDEMVRSSPVVGDIDGDGQNEVVFGAGNYWVNQPGGASDSTKVFVLNAKTGTLKWSKDLAGQTLASPALVDVNGDGRREVAIGTWDGSQPGRVWVLDGVSGVATNGYPRLSGGGIVIGQISSADLNADGRQDLIVPTGSGVYAYDGTNGAVLWGLRQGAVSYQNTPLVQDIDNNGRLDIILAGGKSDGTGEVVRYEFSTANEASEGTGNWSMFHGDMRLTGNVNPPPLRQHIDIPAGANGQGYVLVSDTGRISAHGSAPNNGQITNTLVRPIVGMATLPDKDGYWMVASDGGIFSFGDARFFGSTGNIKLNKPIVGMAPTVSGNGYWMVASDGGIFSFGDASFKGSTGGIQLNKPIVSMMRAPGNGYWLVASDGGIFSFGAPFYGSGINSGSVVSGSVQGYW